MVSRYPTGFACIKHFHVGHQNLRYVLISLDRFEEVQTGQLPLLKGMTLKWIGVSEEGVSRRRKCALFFL